jgi:hypothetical protein
VLVTHPFHPLSGRRLVCVGERYNRYGKRLLLQVGEERICSVPPQWTDVAAIDPEIVLGAGRAWLRLTDLLELAALVEQLAATHPCFSSKANYAANVNTKTPRSKKRINREPSDRSTKLPTKRRRRLDDHTSKRRK